MEFTLLLNWMLYLLRITFLRISLQKFRRVIIFIRTWVLFLPIMVSVLPFVMGRRIRRKIIRLVKVPMILLIRKERILRPFLYILINMVKSIIFPLMGNILFKVVYIRSFRRNIPFALLRSLIIRIRNTLILVMDRQLLPLLMRRNLRLRVRLK